MSEKPKRLNEVLETFAPQGANDARWFFVEHQLAQIKFSIEAIERTLREIMNRPENDNDGQSASECHYIVVKLRRSFLQHYATYRSYLSNTNVPERIGRKEL